ncbi:MAG: hypothetical protein IJL92_04985 [Thermoguttaceae bacterium]|nr:hypothetical protein [Thermoguttaceae bacterium]
MTTKNYPSQIYKLSGETPCAYVFVVQAATAGESLTLAQLETARHAAASVLEIVGATVASASAVLALEPVPEGTSARLVLEPRVEFADGEE